MQPFKPAFGLANKHIQTLFASFFRKDENLTFEIEKFELPDGDFLDCYWHNKPNKQTNKPIVILFHGLAGSYKSPYIQGMISTLSQNGFSALLMHFRGSSGETNRLARAYHSGDTQDALLLIRDTKENFPNSKLFALGYSVGGNMLLKLLGESKKDCLLSGAISVSAPMQLEVCAKQINHGFSKIYQKYLLSKIYHQLQEKYALFDMQTLIGIKKEDIKNIKTFLDFDEIYTAPIHGFSSVQGYYAESSSKQFLKFIEIPTLILHSFDDPFMTPDVLPKEDEVSPFVKLEISSYGGHIGFVSGSIFKPIYWIEERVVSYFREFI